METDVLIVGAGPTGLALACQLIRYGVDFAIIDKTSSTTSHSRALGVQARTLEIYEQFGIADELVERGWIAERVKLVEGGRVRGEVQLSDIGKGMSPYAFLLIVEQRIHEQILETKINASGRKVMWGHELISFTHGHEGVRAEIHAPDGQLSIDAKFIVGCDGASSLIRRSLDLSFEGDTIERLFYVADVRIDSEFDHAALHVCLAENSVTAFFPMRGDERWRIVGTFPEGHEADPEAILYEEIERRILEDTELELDITDVNWFSAYKVHSRRVERFSSGRCFLAGDSAHIHTPAGAQGMNTGIQDGYDLAWKLAFVCNGLAGPDLLNTYNEERLPNAVRLLKTTDRFFELGASEAAFLSFFRTKIFPYIANFALNLNVVQRAIFPLVSQIGINYRESSLSRDEAYFKVKAGDRMPWFEIEGESVYRRLTDPEMHLLIFDDGTSKLPEFAIEPAGICGKTTLPLYPHVAEIFGTDETFSLVLRPDNYIGYIAGGVDADAVREYIKKILR